LLRLLFKGSVTARASWPAFIEDAAKYSIFGRR